MALECYLFDVLTGGNLRPLPVESATWSVAVNSDETTTVDVPSRAAITKALRVWQESTPHRAGILAVADGLPVAAGPVTKRNYGQGGSIRLTGGGLRSHLERRLCLPVGVRTSSLTDANGNAATAYDTNLSGLSYGTIAKRYLQQMLMWPNGNLPIDFPADELGDRVRNVAALDLKRIRALVDDLSNVIGGPDIAFTPRWAPDGLGIRWQMQHGSTAAPRLGLGADDAVTFTVGASTGGAFDLSIDEDGSTLAEEVFATAGRSSDRTLAARSRLTTLSNAGYPLLQNVDTSHTDVTLQSTIQSYADQGAYLGQYAVSGWSMKIRAHESGVPPLGDYWVGDVASLAIDPAEPALGGTGPYLRRIAKISGDEKNDSYALTFSEALA